MGAGADPEKMLHWIDSLQLEREEERKDRFLIELCQAAGPDWTKNYMEESTAEGWIDGWIAENAINIDFFEASFRNKMLDVIESHPDVKTALIRGLKDRLKAMEYYISLIENHRKIR